MADKITKAPTPTPSRSILWKAVEPRHYQRAADLKKVSLGAYEGYVISLAERFDGRLIGVPGQSYGELPVGAVQLSKEQIAQALAAFEAEFGEDNEPKVQGHQV